MLRPASLIKTSGANRLVPRIKGWIDGGAIGTLREIHVWTSRPQSGGSFLNAQIITDTVNLATVALRAGRTIRYDPAARSLTDLADANKYFVREYRKGWDL